jgi:hypothetical protein
MKGQCKVAERVDATLETNTAAVLPTLAAYWDELASYAFTPDQGRCDILKFFELEAIAQQSSSHEKMMSQFWDAAFDGVPRPARPRS